MHIVLVPAPFIQERRTVPYFPLGILSLHQVLADAGHDCTIYYPLLDAADPAEPDTAVRSWAGDIVATEPDWVGFSTMCDAYPLVLLLAREVKDLSPHTPVVLGGPQASAVAEESMAAFPWIDYVVRGEAESVVLELVQAVEKRSELEGVASITYRLRGKIVSTPLAPLLSDLDSLPVPDFRAYPYYHEALLHGIPPIEDGFMPFEPGRGCAYGCTFCSTSGFWRRRVRQKSPRLLVEQLVMIVQNYEAQNVFLVQDLLVVDKQWFSDTLHALEVCGKVAWGCYLRPDSVASSALADMENAGCRYIFFGVDSGSQWVQKRIGKNLDIPRARKIVEAAAATGMTVATSFIVGFPWETRQDLQNTLSLHQYFLSIGVDRSYIHLLSPLPKTHITTRYASELAVAPAPSSISGGLEGFRNAEIDGMIRRYPQIFSSFYYVKPEFVSHEEFVVAAWAGNALSALSQKGQTRTGAEHKKGTPL